MHQTTQHKLASHFQTSAQERTPVRLPQWAKVSNFEEAYAIQECTGELWEALGEKVVGYKVACTTEQGQKALGMRSPAYALLSRNGDVSADPNVSIRTPYRLAVECELAFILKKDLSPQDDVQSAIGRMMVACEVVEDRYAGLAEAGPLCLVADNWAHRCYALGPALPFDSIVAQEPAGLSGFITYNGAVESDDTPGPLHPIAAMQWLQSALAKRGKNLKQGELVLTGAIGRPYWLGSSGEATVGVKGIGEISLNFK